MTTGTYTAMVDGTADDAQCHCDDCDWTGPAIDTKDVDDCVLTPGDPSPVGRCPACDTLAYVIKAAASKMLFLVVARREGSDNEWTTFLLPANDEAEFVEQVCKELGLEGDDAIESLGLTTVGSYEADGRLAIPNGVDWSVTP